MLTSTLGVGRWAFSVFEVARHFWCNFFTSYFFLLTYLRRATQNCDRQHLLDLQVCGVAFRCNEGDSGFQTRRAHRVLSLCSGAPVK